ncbi:MAG TPA: PH domain-containing protein [Acidimicrobiales bacterium]|nr:PH domain-containing protein [Acidimicrobiales bacterium]
MSFPRRLLNDGEDVVLELRPHWWTFVQPIATVVLLVALAVVVNVTVGNTYLTLAAVALVVAGLVWLLVRYLRRATTLFVVTTDRLVLRHGVLAKHGKEIPLERVNDISVSQTVFERLLRAGSVLIESGGERGQELVPSIPRPFEVQNVIYTEIERAQARAAERQVGRRELSVPEQIEKLDELRQRGVITQAEFDAKKAQLLDRL